MNFNKLKEIFKDNGCDQIYVKRLSPNDNSKNQVYLGGSFDILNIFPISKITADSSGDWKKDRFKAKLDYYWITKEGSLSQAPHSQLILYPKYPEVRFSGFLLGCKDRPSILMANRIENRLLFLGSTNIGSVIGFVASPDSMVAQGFNNSNINHESHGVFQIINLSKSGNNRVELINELKRIHNLGWINSKRLNSEKEELPCNSSNCGGYTLEAELGITPNSFSEPDFLGWEIKQFGVSNFKSIYSKVITLMTPEPNGGDYSSLGVQEYLRRYGYPDKRGRKDRINFGGVHKVGIRHKTTELTLSLIGYDKESGKIKNSNGKIVLLTDEGKEAASWSFASLLKHWNRKHNQACYLPSLSEVTETRRYKYANKAILGIGTDFTLFLSQMDKGNIYYDPGIKMENVSTKPKIKRRSQFRIKSGQLKDLYKINEITEF